jgi:hypothetical protein
MAKVYIPKINDLVFMDGHSFTRYAVVRVNEKNKTADVKTVTGTGLAGVHENIPWSNLHHLDESQNAARIVREATKTA